MNKIEAYLKEHRITEVECTVSALTRTVRRKHTPTAKLMQAEGMRQPESILLQSVTGDYVDDDVYYDLLDPADIDMICKPDDDGIYLVPWAIEPTAQIIHDCYDKHGVPIEMSP